MRGTLFAEELRPYQRLTPAEIAQLLTPLERASLLVPGPTEVQVCRDPDDDKFFAAALEGAAEYIVSSNPDHQAVGTYRGTTVLSPPPCPTCSPKPTARQTTRDAEHPLRLSPSV